MQITPLSEGRRPVLVVSHERSGTHFTMNAAAKCFDYVSQPWIDVDRHQMNINYYAPQDLKEALTDVAQRRPANILKSHHEFAFFAEILDKVAAAYQLIYVYRHPADCLASYWRLLNTLHWREGPRCATALDFATTPPMGRLMRYQEHQYGTMLDRWANHVRGWVTAAEGRRDIHVLRYEDLAGDYEAAIRALGERLGQPPERIERPSRHENVVKAGSAPFAPAPGADNRAAVAELALRTYPKLMARLGYGESLAIAS